MIVFRNKKTQSGDLPKPEQVFFWNYLLHVLEGGFFVSGLVFIAANSIMPKLADLLHAPNWIISLTPTLLMLGFSFPTLLTAFWIERQERVHSFLSIIGIGQRLPYLFAALVLWFAGEQSMKLILLAVFSAPLLSGIFGGISQTAWFELVAKTVPVNRRSSLFALRSLIAGIIGIMAGGIITAVLTRFPGIKGFAVLHMICFVFLMLSLLLFIMLRETRQPARSVQTHVTLKQKLKEMPGLIKKDKRLRHLLISNFFSNAVYIMVPFLAIHVLRTTGKPNSFLGILVIAQMSGTIFSNIFASYIGDKHSAKLNIYAGILCIIGASGCASSFQHINAFITSFFLLGMGLQMMRIGKMTLNLEIAPFEKRTTYLAILSFMNTPGILLASLTSSLLWSLNRGYPPLAWTTIGLLIISICFFIRVKDPRNDEHTEEIIR
jgi:MFS family permease